jgi:hypothetical protein
VRQRLRWFLRLAVTGGIVTYILTNVDRGDLLRTLSGVRPGLVAVALAIYLIGNVLAGWKWSMLGRAVGLEPTVAPYVRFYFIGMFFNLFGPSTLGGDLVRALYLGHGRRRTVAFNSVVFDRASGLALLMALGVAAILAFPRYELPRPLVVAVVAGGLGLLVGWWTCPRLVRLLPAHNPLRRHVEHDLAPFWHDRAMLLRIAAVSIVFHLTQVVVQWILARAAGASVPFGYCLLYHPLVSVMTALPVSIGGFGVREGGYLYFLGLVGVDDSVAVTVGLLWFSLTLFGGLLGGLVFASAGGQVPIAQRDPIDSQRPSTSELAAAGGS